MLGPLGIIALLFFYLILGLVLVILTWSVFRFAIKKLGLQSDKLSADLFRIYILGIFTYIFYLLTFIWAGGMYQTLKPHLPKSGFFSMIILFGVLPAAWIFWASIILGKSIRFSDGIGIGKVKAGSIFITGILIVLSIIYSILYLLEYFYPIH